MILYILNKLPNKVTLSLNVVVFVILIDQTQKHVEVVQSIYFIEDDNRARVLTPLETWRLQGFSDEDFCKAQEVCKNTYLYKQAGNSISVNVLEAIFKQIYKGDE